MTDRNQLDITAMLSEWNDGDAGALDRLMDLVRPKIRRIAHRHLQRLQTDESLESTALANET